MARVEQPRIECCAPKNASSGLAPGGGKRAVFGEKHGLAVTQEFVRVAETFDDKIDILTRRLSRAPVFRQRHAAGHRNTLMRKDHAVGAMSGPDRDRQRRELSLAMTKRADVNPVLVCREEERFREQYVCA